LGSEKVKNTRKVVRIRKNSYNTQVSKTLRWSLGKCLLDRCLNNHERGKIRKLIFNVRVITLEVKT
jgi:hypothetical protein